MRRARTTWRRRCTTRASRARACHRARCRRPRAPASEPLRREPRPFGDDFGATLWGGTLYELEPGKSSPYHWQMGEEECCVVISGTPTLRTPDGERVLEPWDVAWFVRGPAGAHGLRNDTDEPARIVFFSTVSDPEVAAYPDDGKVGVIAGFRSPNVETIRGWVDVQ